MNTKSKYKKFDKFDNMKDDIINKINDNIFIDEKVEDNLKREMG